MRAEFPYYSSGYLLRMVCICNRVGVGMERLDPARENPLRELDIDPERTSRSLVERT